MDNSSKLNNSESADAKDPLNMNVSPERVNVAFAWLQPAYALALDQYKTQEVKASSLAGWIAAVIALSANLINGHMLAAHRDMLAFALLLFVIAFFLAVSAIAPRSLGKAALKDPYTGIYAYQSRSDWDNDTAAEHETKLRLVEDTDAAIKALREGRNYKSDRILWSLYAFGFGMSLVVISSVMGPISSVI